MYKNATIEFKNIDERNTPIEYEFKLKRNNQ